MISVAPAGPRSRMLSTWSSECPAYAASRARVMQTLHGAARKDSDLRRLMSGHDEASVLAASLGAPLTGAWRQDPLDMGPYSTMVGLAGPVWAAEFSELC